ncbi:prephenate dehydratase [Burkholderia sp. TSV86]|uniref:prephenate dehydratase n=1 Tax=Burkholderia sp. TSV86 TaxID=1385594 RepID=UPI000A922686|nr:prephenate dehydratase [Burkholderia sp. TSV86]
MTDLSIGRTPTPNDEIARHRTAIMTIDERLIALLNERLDHAQAIGQVKRSMGERVHQPAREQEILASLGECSSGPLTYSHVRAIWTEIFRISHTLQEGPTVAFLGPPGTYTEDAMHTHFGHSVHALPCDSIDAVFCAIDAGSAHYGVVPIENSTEGTIMRTLDLVLDKSMQIFAEVALPISHCLMSADGRMDGIASVTAHPQALGQCRRWLDANLPHAERAPAASNAHAARLANTAPGMAAIASRRTAARYALTVLAADIQDERLNSTRFSIIGKHAAAPRDDERTLIAVELENNTGALLRCLSPLAARCLAVTRIDSRPLKSELWAYRFFIEIGCCRHHPNLLDALHELRTAVTSLRVLGAYAATATYGERRAQRGIEIPAVLRAINQDSSHANRI